MNILIVGLGVIGTTYGYLFQKKGYHVEHLIRESSKMASVKELDIELLDGRTNPGGEKTTDRYSVFKRSKRKYDFIFVSVPSGNIADVTNTLREENIHGTIILCCGIWQGHDYVDKQMHGFSYILGYPVAGGNMDENRLSCCVFDHFMLEKKEKTTISNYNTLSQLFSDCNIKAENPYDMLEWIWLHMAINAGVVSVAGKYGNVENISTSAETLMNSQKKLAEAIKAIRETIKIIEARGVILKNYRNELFAYKLPTLISAPIMKNMFKKNILTRKIMTLHGNLKDLLFVCKSVYDEGQQRNIKAPTFYNSYESMLNKIDRL
ncbi:MAG: 2-dehydropantoate 2-reductase N-terminal domain-containing protein [Anaerostipes sp.]|nr:2-dehydropantoate 2-reductase N-terminal domain-containing protein [Anaerostipes sp.]